MAVDAADLVTAVQVVFMKIRPEGLPDPQHAYRSERVGRPSGREARLLGGTGKPVIGVHGRRGAVIDGVGLILAP